MKTAATVKALWVAVLCGLSVFWLTACTPVQFQYMQFTIYTGGDNLDGSKSTAAAFLALSDGSVPGVCVVNYTPPNQPAPFFPGFWGPEIPPIPTLGGPQNQTFNNDSTHVVTRQTGPTDVLKLIGSTIQFALYQKFCDTYCDNWDIEGIAVSVSNTYPATGPICQLKIGYFGPGDHGEHPAIARLKGGNSQPGPIFSSNTQVYTLGQSCNN